MNREPLGRLHRAGPWICAASVLLLVALCPWLFRNASGDGWVWRWAAFGVLVLVVVVAYAALASFADYRASQASPEHETPDDADLWREAYVEESYAASTESAPEAETRPEPTPEAAPEQQTAAELIASADVDEELRGLVKEYQRQAESTQVALLSLGRKVQASAHRIQQEAARTVAKHPSDPDVLETGLRLDHAAAQQARLAQSIATLCGMRPGQQWYEPMPLSDVAWAAAGRITAYKRVRVDGDPTLAVNASVAEPLIHLLAEVLANATQSSPPATEVIVTLRATRRGASIEVDDCGVGMDEAGLRRAREIATGRRTVTLADLGEIPQTGLAVVGTYVRRHGFRVDLGESVHGGLRVSVIVPPPLTVSMPDDSVFSPDNLTTSAKRTSTTELDPPPAAKAKPKAPEPPTPPTPTVPPTPSGLTPEGLPKRQSQRERAGSDGASKQVPPAPQPDKAAETPRRPSAEQAGAWMGSYLAATKRPHPPPADQPAPAPDAEPNPTTPETGEAHDES